MPRRYWLLKSEADCFSFDDLLRAPGRTTYWDGVRNYQARNFMRDDMCPGDGVLFYHSNAEPAGVAGIAVVSRAAYPDPTAFDASHEHFDAKSRRDAPTWVVVDVTAVAPCARYLPLPELRAEPALDGLELLRRGSRLSVQPVSAEHWAVVCRMAGVSPDAAVAAVGAGGGDGAAAAGAAPAARPSARGRAAR